MTDDQLKLLEQLTEAERSKLKLLRAQVELIHSLWWVTDTQKLQLLEQQRLLLLEAEKSVS